MRNNKAEPSFPVALVAQTVTGERAACRRFLGRRLSRPKMFRQRKEAEAGSSLARLKPRWVWRGDFDWEFHWWNACGQ